ncbi:MAG: hypothetical protein ACYTG0_34085, partial [Planctomycetota bacterium]
MPDLPTQDDLRQLSTRMIVACAVRSALRVRPPFVGREADVDGAIRVAIDYCSSIPFVGFDPKYVAYNAQAAEKAGVGSDKARNAAFSAAHAAMAVYRAIAHVGDALDRMDIRAMDIRAAVAAQ